MDHCESAGTVLPMLVSQGLCDQDVPKPTLEVQGKALPREYRQEQGHCELLHLTKSIAPQQLVPG